MKSLLYHGFGIKGYRYLRTRYEKGEIIFELEPEGRPEVPQGQKLMRRGFRWRDVRTVAIGLKPVVLRVKVPRWLNTTTGEEFEQSPLCRSLHENHAQTRIPDGGSGAIHDFERHRWLVAPELGHG
jgi:hypothetical protein